MATWSEFAADAPEVAAAGEALLTQFGPGLGFLATVRADGAPRLHPVCPVVAEGELWAFIVRSSPKCGDLRRDGRDALHAFPPEAADDEFLLLGSVQAVDDPAAAAAVQAATSARVGMHDEVLFRFDIDRALLSRYEARGQYLPVFTRWRAPLRG